MPKMASLLFLFIAATAFIVDALVQSAVAQCAVDNKTVFIDPRLVPPPSRYTIDDMRNMAANQFIDPRLRDAAMQMYMRQFSPIEMPYSGGRVLINPQNPCIQQFIPN